jgi:hypothetical protein
MSQNSKSTSSPLADRERAKRVDRIGIAEKLFSSGLNRYHICLGLVIVAIGYSALEVVHWLLRRGA